MSTASSAPEKHLRLACNRCHAQKLRCPRSTESDRSGPDEPCSRCRKAGAPCIVSKRGKVGRPSKRKATSPPLTDGDEASSRDGHQELEKPSSAGAITVHVFDLGPDVTMQHSQLTPPDTGNRPQMCDAETILLNAERTVTVPNDANGVDPAATAWPSEHSWPCETFHTDPNCYPGSESMLFEPFLQDMKLDLDLPTFHFTPEASETFDLTGSTVGSNNKDVDRTLAQMFNNGAKKPLTPPYGSTADLSRTASLLKLSDLSTRIIRLSEQQRSSGTNTPVEGEASPGHQIVQQIVDFSGELIDIARQSIPRLAARPTSSKSSTTSDTETSTADDCDDDDGSSRLTAANLNGFATVGAPLSAPCIPESALIFLLLGCYTQLLFSFEVAIDYLYSEHSALTLAPGIDKGYNPGTVNSLLKASLLIHTVTYLLGRVHKAFAIGDASNSKDGEEGQSLNTEGWKRSLLGDKSINEGLLGRSFVEIQEREQCLMRKAQHLRHMIGAFQI